MWEESVSHDVLGVIGWRQRQTQRRASAAAGVDTRQGKHKSEPVAAAPGGGAAGGGSEVSD